MGGMAMTEAALTEVVTSLLSVAGLLLLLRLYLGYSVDRFRQEMFALRDEVFDFAATGQIAFQHPAYGLLRLTMNGFVRWADRLHLLNIAVLVLVSRRDDLKQNAFDVKWEKALVGLDAGVQKQLNSYRDRMHQILGAYLLLRSPMLVVTFILPFVTWAMGMWLTRSMTKREKTRFDRIDAVAFKHGERRSIVGKWVRSKMTALA